LVNENSNASIQAVVSMLRKLARDTGAAIHLIHHVRKGNGEDATIDSVRGAGALIGAARAARVINKVSEEEALSLGVNHDEAKGIFRVDDGKANLAPPAEKAVYRRMVGVELANGEWVGVAIEFKLPDVFEGITAKDTRKVQDIVGGAMQNKKPYRQNIQAADWVGHAVGDVLGIDTHTDQGKGRVKRIVKTWIANDVLRMDKIEDERKKREVPIVVVGQWVNWDEM
jgi:outer membrane lipoprotein SlyB